MTAYRSVLRASSLVVLALVSACGTRVSLGELGDDPTTDGTFPMPDASLGDATGSISDGGTMPDVGVITTIPDASQDAGPDAPGDVDGGSVYRPCAGKACGDSCRLCDPLDFPCAEPAVIKACDKAGECVAAPTTC